MEPEVALVGKPPGEIRTSLVEQVVHQLFRLGEQTLLAARVKAALAQAGQMPITVGC